MDISLERVEYLLLIAAVVGMLAQRVRLPYTVGLVLAGGVLSLLGWVPHIVVTKDLVFRVLLPPLIFDAALYIEWPELRRDFGVVLVLATVGVVLSAAVTAAGMHWLAGWTWATALLFSVLIAATDPVSVIATFKEAGASGRLRLLVEAESLFNDGTAAVFFTIALAVVQGQSVGLAAVVRSFLVTSLLGVGCGALVAGGIVALVGQTEDHLVEISFTTVAAFGSFWLAEYFHLSGVLAALTAGIIIGNIGSLGSFSDRGREAVCAFWEYAAFVANSLVFLLIGIRLTHQPFAQLLLPSLVAILVVLVSRAVAVYPCCALFARSTHRVTMRDQHILFWGGLRGALALALALGLPADMPERETIHTVAFAVVAFSVVVQGLTIRPLLVRLGAVAPA